MAAVHPRGHSDARLPLTDDGISRFRVSSFKIMQVILLTRLLMQATTNAE